MKRVSILSMVIVLTLAQPLASVSAAPPPATEITQIMNNVQLFSSYREQIQQTLQQVRIYQQALKDLRQLSPQRLAEMGLDAAGLDVGDDVRNIASVVDEVGNTLGTLNDAMYLIQGEGVIAADTISLLRQRGITISDQDYFGSYALLARRRQDTYGRRYNALMQAAKSAESDIDRVNKLAATAPQLQTSVEGFGALLQSNAVMSSQLAGVRQVLTTSALAQTETAQKLAEDVDRNVESLSILNAWGNNVLATPGDDGE